MSLVIHLANSFKVKEFSDKITQEDIKKVFPKLLWVLRDFSLKLVDSENNPITMNEYLENSLKDVKGLTDNIQQKNRIRKVLRDFFQERECYCLVRPLEDEDELQNLENIEYNKFRPEFINGIKEIRNIIDNNIEKKKINDKFVNGPMLLSIAEAYTKGINEKGIPVLQTAWNYMCENHNNKLISNFIDK